jgi:hypothetical protein
MNRNKSNENFVCCQYSDGTPSREIEDGEEEMNELHDQCKAKEEKRASVVDVRDRLNHLSALIDICKIALTNPQWQGQAFLQNQVASVLCDFVSPELESAEKELRKV